MPDFKLSAQLKGHEADVGFLQFNYHDTKLIVLPAGPRCVLPNR